MKYLLYASLILALLVFIQELSYLDSSLGLVVAGLAIAIALQAFYLIKKNK